MDLDKQGVDRFETAEGLAEALAPAPNPLKVDVAIVGGGLSGALLALMLARTGAEVAVIDGRATYRSEFRCEKLHAAQIAKLDELGLLEAVESALPSGGRMSDTGFRYDQVVNALRAAWPASVRFIQAQVADIVPAAEGERQRLLSEQGELALARLAVLATGPSPRLAARLGITRRLLRENQSICIGLTMTQADGGRFPFAGLVHPGERAGDKLAFISLFRLGAAMRVNAFTYHDPHDPWLREVRDDPLAALARIAPGLAPVLAKAKVAEPVEMRITDLYRAEDVLRPGLVLIGDAFQSSCPATAHGVTRLLSDIRQLALTHLPVWLATPGMGVDKIAAFYDDPAKRAVDAEGLRKAASARAAAVETGPYWRARRLAAAGKRRLDALRQPRRNARPLARGDWVQVRSATEIAATLDAEGRLDGLPFMPEMAALCGQRLQVARRAAKTCVEGFGLRGMRDTVFLTRTRCDGAAHDGCERACLMFWKEAWLAPGGERARPVDPFLEEQAARRLLALKTREGDLYLCQSTALAGATFEMSRWSVGHLIDDLRRGELSLTRFGEIVLRTAANMARRALRLDEIGVLRGPDGKTTLALELQPGERVRVRPAAEVAATLDANGRNRGLSFEPEMTHLIGGDYTVAGPVKRIIIETSGRMATLKSTVALQGVDCQGRCTRNCPRGNPLYWREIWLKRI